MQWSRLLTTSTRVLQPQGSSIHAAFVRVLDQPAHHMVSKVTNTAPLAALSCHPVSHFDFYQTADAREIT